jgi:hypothetical protein
MREKAAAALLALGLLQMAGDAFDIAALRGIGLATAASPAPRVFTSLRGLETFSTRFYLDWTSRDGSVHHLALTPDVYGRLRGAYNRRNAYGAALAAGPVLATQPRTRRMFEAVLAHALCGEAPVLHDLGLDAADIDGPVQIRYQVRPGLSTPDLPLIIRSACG